jgi:predicted dinucleotide-binding enzyme
MSCTSKRAARRNDLRIVNSQPSDRRVWWLRGFSPKSLKDAVEADIVLLAVPFGTQKDIAKAAESWQGKIVIDVTNAKGVAPERTPSSTLSSRNSSR